MRTLKVTNFTPSNGIYIHTTTQPQRFVVLLILFYHDNTTHTPEEHQQIVNIPIQHRE